MHKWEPVYKENGVVVLRFSVPGGWVYGFGDELAPYTFCFVPEPLTSQPVTSGQFVTSQSVTSDVLEEVKEYSRLHMDSHSRASFEVSENLLRKLEKL